MLYSDVTFSYCVAIGTLCQKTPFSHSLRLGDITLLLLLLCVYGQKISSEGEREREAIITHLHVKD